MWVLLKAPGLTTGRLERGMRRESERMGGAEGDFVFEQACVRLVKYDKKGVLSQAGVHKKARGVSPGLFSFM
jgi:hypothetical protein